MLSRMSIRSNSSIYSDGIIFIPSPISYSSAVSTLLLTTLNGATRIQTAQNVSIEMELRMIEKYKATFIKCLPYKLNQMLKSEHFAQADLSSVQHMFVEGYKAPSFILEQINERMENATIHNRYGMPDAMMNSFIF